MSDDTGDSPQDTIPVPRELLDKLRWTVYLLSRCDTEPEGWRLECHDACKQADELLKSHDHPST